jgi:hypothetical protein
MITFPGVCPIGLDKPTGIGDGSVYGYLVIAKLLRQGLYERFNQFGVAVGVFKVNFVNEMNSVA